MNLSDRGHRFGPQIEYVGFETSESDKSEMAARASWNLKGTVPVIVDRLLTRINRPAAVKQLYSRRSRRPWLKNTIDLS